MHQERLEKLREIDQGLHSIQDIVSRLDPNHFVFGDIIRNHPNFTKYQEDANRYLAILGLVEAGYHPRELEIHFLPIEPFWILW